MKQRKVGKRGSKNDSRGGEKLLFGFLRNEIVKDCSLHLLYHLAAGVL